MKQLTCEMCGSTDLIKQDGVFVCQTCGCKYSIEEARKMMVEGTVEVTGTVKIDQTGAFNNLLQAARTSMSDGRFGSAYTHSAEALAIQPDHPELTAIQGLADFGKEKIIAEVPSSATNAVNRFCSGISSWDVSFAEKRTALQNVKKYVRVACKYQYEQLNDEISDLRSQLVDYSEGEERAAKWNQAAQVLAGNVFTQASAKNDLKDIQQRRQHNERIDSKISKVSDRRRKVENFETSSIKRIDSLLSSVSRQEQDYIAQKKAEYWEAHKEEKERLEADIAAWGARVSELIGLQNGIRERIRKINDELKTIKVPSALKAEEIKDKIRELENRRAGLGIFKGKEKKEITETIASLNQQVPSYETIKQEEDAAKAARAPEIKALEEEMKPFAEESSALSKKIAEAEAELRKER